MIYVDLKYWLTTYIYFERENIYEKWSFDREFKIMNQKCLKVSLTKK